MPARNRADIARYTAIFKGLYQTLADLEALTACHQGHPFLDSYIVQDGQVVEVRLNVRIEPSGQVVCRLCANARASTRRRLEREGKDFPGPEAVDVRPPAEVVEGGEGRSYRLLCPPDSVEGTSVE